MDEEVLVKLAERVSPEGAALLLALHGRQDLVVGRAEDRSLEIASLNDNLARARQAISAQEMELGMAKETISKCWQILDDQLGKDTEAVTLPVRVLAAALGARQRLQHASSKGWTYPKRGDKLRLVKIPPPEVCSLCGEDEWRIGMSLEVPTTDWVYGGYMVPGTGEEGPTVRVSSAFLKSSGCLFIPFDCVEPA